MGGVRNKSSQGQGTKGYIDSNHIDSFTPICGVHSNGLVEQKCGMNRVVYVWVLSDYDSCN